ncbi:protein SAAL1 isoform X2 [Linepithema humile]
MSYDFPKIARNVLEKHDQPRLIEIILGIIGNICCKDEVIDTIGRDKDLVTQILNNLESDDTLTLIQLLRILQCTAWRITVNPQSDWITHFTECKFFGDSIIFILRSSTNDELLLATTSVLVPLSRINLSHQKKFFEEIFKIDNLISALLESFIQLISVEKISYSRKELTFIEQWVEVLIFIIELGSLKFEDYENDEHFFKLMEIMYRILKPYEELCNLFPIQQKEVNVIYETMRILISFRCCNVNIPPKIDHIVATILFSLKTVLDSEKEELNSQEQMGMILHCLDQYWLQIMGLCTTEQIVEILRLCKREVWEYLINTQSVNIHVKSLCDRMHNLFPNMKRVELDTKIKPEMLEKVKKAAAVLEES